MTINISVALTVYNGERYLTEQLQSIRDQELLPFEIVIVDDCSADASAAIIKDFDFGTIQCRYYKNEHNLGPVANFKKAIGLCTGNFIALCDQDDVWLPAKLKRLYEAMAVKNQWVPAVSFSDVSLTASNGTVIAASIFKEAWKIKPCNYTFKMLLIENVIIGCSCMINRKMQDEVLKMPTQGVMMHDHWIALIGNTLGEASFINEPLLLYRSHNASVTLKVPVTGLISKIKREFGIMHGYLEDNMQQAKQFKEVYYKDLSIKDKRTLNRFLKLGKMPFLIKRLYTKTLKMYVNK